MPSILDTRRLSAFKKLELMARRVVEGFITGLHKSPFKGFAIEFDQHRPYVPGDDIKHIDWKVMAKTGKHYIKEYEEDTSLRGYIVLDRSGSMAYTSARYTKYDYARFVAAVMSYMLISQKDAVGMAVCDSEIRHFFPPKSTSIHYRNLIDTLEETETGEDTGLASVLHSLATRIKRRALIVIISDFFDDVEGLSLALNHFAHKNHEVVLFQVLDRRESEFPFNDLTRFESLEGETMILTDPVRIRREYLRQFQIHQKALQKTCHERRIDFVPVFTDEPIERTLAKYLVGRLRR